MSPKRTLEELVLIYQTEPTLFDVFCEGPSDLLILKFFTDAIESKSTGVYSADQIEWPHELGSHGGHRSRIVFLSNALSSKTLKAICVVDKDLDTIENRTPNNTNLIKSDYANIDMYGLETDDLRTFIYSKFNLTVSEDQLASVFDACKRLFTIRFLRERHCPGSTIAPADDMLTDASSFAFSVDDYLERCRQLNGYDVRWNKVINEQDALYISLNGNFREYINVHDLGEILVAIIRKQKSKSVSLTPDFIAKHCGYVVMAQRLFGYPLFSDISTRLTG
jgi:hypothetical protein